MKKKVFYSILIILLLLQLIPINRTNPIVESDLIASEKIKSIFKKSCYDCHSNETKYPVYSYIFPVSLFLAHHIEEARDELNFSNWEALSVSKKSTKAKEIIEEIEEKEMPLLSYTLMHREAILSSEEIEEIKKWAEEIQNKNEANQ